MAYDSLVHAKMTAEELKRAISNYALGPDLPVEEFVEIAEAIDAVYEALVVQTSERDRWQGMIDIIEETHGAALNHFSPVRLLNEMISLKERLRLADIALEKADVAVRPWMTGSAPADASDAYLAARKEYDRMWRVSPR